MKNNLRETRKKCGLSQEELSRQSKVGRATISILECGRGSPRAGTMERLAKVLRKPVREIFFL